MELHCFAEMGEPQTSVTPEEIVAAILLEFEKTIVPGYYANYARNIFRVYLYHDDYTNLRAFQDRIRDEATRALQEELKRQNASPSLARALPFQRKQRHKRCEPLGDWIIEILTNEDDDAAKNPLIVHSEGSTPPESGSIEGPPTVRVNRPGLDDSASRTRRTGFAGSTQSAAVYARLSYADDSGQHTFDMIKDIIKVGRGGPNEWVDLKLLTIKDVSREHFQIRRDASTGKFFIKDLSKYGTWVDSKRVPPSIEMVNGAEKDNNVEIPLPLKAQINLADALSMEFKSLRTK